MSITLVGDITNEELRPEVKEKWLAALRSGDYQQGTQHLRDRQNRFCCLGVLCDIYAKENGLEWVKDHNSNVACRFLDEYAGLPAVVSSWAGFTKYVGLPVVRVGDSEYSLAQLNDTGSSFDVIANIIEKGL